MRIIFYASDNEVVNFIDDKSVQKLGELSIDIGRPFQSVEDKTVKVTLIFGDTQIIATATNKEGTEIRNCEFQFDTAGTAAKAPEPKKPIEKEQPEEMKESEKKVNETVNNTVNQTAPDTTVGEVTFEKEAQNLTKQINDLTN